MADPVADFKQGARASWAAGDWDAVSRVVAPVGPRLIERVGVEEGMDLLDVGTGSGGTVAIPAAQRGARVTGSDLTPELFEDARRRAGEAGVEVEWVEADAEDLPFEDASFDRVLSTFGHMFAPRHERAGAELARVCRPGGVVGTITWTPEGFSGAMFQTIGGYVPAAARLRPAPAAVGRPRSTSGRCSSPMASNSISSGRPLRSRTTASRTWCPCTRTSSARSSWPGQRWAIAGPTCAGTSAGCSRSATRPTTAR